MYIQIIQVIDSEIVGEKLMVGVGETLYVKFQMNRSHIFDFESGERLELNN